MSLFIRAYTTDVFAMTIPFKAPHSASNFSLFACNWALVRRSANKGARGVRLFLGRRADPRRARRTFSSVPEGAWQPLRVSADAGRARTPDPTPRRGTAGGGHLRQGIQLGKRVRTAYSGLDCTRNGLICGRNGRQTSPNRVQRAGLYAIRTGLLAALRDTGPAGRRSVRTMAG